MKRKLKHIQPTKASLGEFNQKKKKKEQTLVNMVEQLSFTCP